jgi:hypothetical protein
MLKQIFGLAPKEHTRVMSILFAYLFNRIGKYEYRKQIGDKDLAKKVWSTAAESWYVLKNCKLYAHAHYVNRRSGLATSPAKFGISAEDVGLLKNLDLSHIKVRHKSYSVFDFDNLEGAILTSSALKAHIGKFISKKLIFLSRSYGLSREEIHGHLLHSALFALRKQYPVYESELHATNICKTAIHNAGMGLIEYWTRDKRNALLRENGGFQAVHVQYDVLSDVGVEPEHNNELRQNLQSLVALTSKLKPKAANFLSAAAGLYDPGVSLFIGTDNSEAAEHWNYSRYLTGLRAYYGVSEGQQRNLLDKLRQKMT